MKGRKARVMLWDAQRLVTWLYLRGKDKPRG